MKNYKTIKQLIYAMSFASGLHKRVDLLSETNIIQVSVAYWKLHVSHILGTTYYILSIIYWVLGIKTLRFAFRVNSMPFQTLYIHYMKRIGVKQYTLKAADGFDKCS